MNKNYVELESKHGKKGQGPEDPGSKPTLTRQAGAPACLTYHRPVGNYLINSAFLLRGHFDGAGRLIPEKVVGFEGIPSASNRSSYTESRIN